MKRDFVRKAPSHSFVIVFVATITFSATLGSLAQVREANQVLTRSSGAVVQQGEVPRLEAWQPRAMTDGAPSRSVYFSPSETTKPNFAPTDSVGASFLPPELSGLGCIPFSIAVGDVNGDGKPDLVVADWFQTCDDVWGPGEVDVLVGHGDGTFEAPVSYASGGFQALGVAVGEVNGDGKLDLVVVNSCASGSGTCNGQVGVLLGKGDGTFQPVVGYSSGESAPYSVTIADVNGDGRPDLVIANYCHTSLGGGCNNPGSAGVLLGNGDGTFQPAVSYPADPDSLTVSLGVADMNGDGFPDVVMLSGKGGPGEAVVNVLLGNGDGTFRPELSYDAGGGGPTSMAVADVDGDGHPDVVVAMAESTGVLSVLLGKGDGTFRAPVIYGRVGFSATSVAIADVNGDGHPDLIAATSYENGSGNAGPGELGVLLGNGDGTFRAAEAFPSGGSGQTSVAVADLNGDGKPDLLLANFCSLICTGIPHGALGVLLNNSGVPQASTTAALVCSPASSSAYGQIVTCTATVRSASGTPTGAVILYDGVSPAGTVQLVKRKAVIPVSSLTAGSHTLMAVYQGSSGFAPRASRGIAQGVVAASTTVRVDSSANPAPIGQLITFTATVVGQYGGATATGTMTFKSGSATLETITVSDNQATYRHVYSTRGIRSITATYSGDSNNGSSTSPAFNEAIGSLPYSSHTVVTTSGSPSSLGQPVTFTATVSFAGDPAPNGEAVTFYDGLTEIGTGSLASGVATFTTSSLTAKTHTIKAIYGGDATLRASRGSVQQTVNH